MKTQNTTPKVTLVGAGPGDLELITLKGLNAIKKAEVILYDALVNEELLEYAPIAEKIFVGKRKGFKAYSQQEINLLLVKYAFSHKNVVRLKGGDSYVFGRGFEELQYVESFGIKTEVVPGISSSISVPALAGIPVTHRGTATSFTVISASLSSGELNPDIKHAAHTNGTVVILMGLSKLEEIVSIYKRAGKFNTGVAIISNGSLENEQIIRGNISSILYNYEENPVPAPAIIVVGEVVNLKSVKEHILVDEYLL
ncbi:MAG: uroporphyrinogen-III C-methyltransferase [Crocinitomicaceae bacterium]|jgi:uroporphyrin-III C-methyltransferase